MDMELVRDAVRVLAGRHDLDVLAEVHKQPRPYADLLRACGLPNKSLVRSLRRLEAHGLVEAHARTTPTKIRLHYASTRSARDLIPILEMLATWWAHWAPTDEKAATLERSPSFDPQLPSPARVYDALLGGSSNFPADRERAEWVLKIAPESQDGAIANRGFLGRAVEYLVEEEGITQFLDIGSGLPTEENVHQVALRHAPDARVVYVDNDPYVLAHARALLHGTNVEVVDGDLRNPQRILAQPAVRNLLDWERPVAILLLAVLHFLQDEDDPHGVVTVLKDAVPSGGCLAVTHVTNVGRYKELAAIGRQSSVKSPTTFRSPPEISRFFDGLEMVPPGLVWPGRWRAAQKSEGDEYVLAGVGRKL